MRELENPYAFPFAAEYGHPAACGGMTLRDWFAGQALVGLLNPAWETDAEAAPAKAYELAEAMLVIRATPPEQGKGEGA